MFVFNGKSDRDGSEQPTLCIASARNERLVFFDEEEVAELVRITPRIQEYMNLWIQKAEMNKLRVDENERRKLSASESIGVEL
jgi:hypothetical protein